MGIFFYLPELTELGIVFKLAALILFLMLVHWLLTLIIVNTVYGDSEYPRELEIWRAQYSALIWTLAFLHIYLLALLNWNLGILGTQSFSEPEFYLKFLPEFCLSIALMVLIGAKKRHILQAVKIEV